MNLNKATYPIIFLIPAALIVYACQPYFKTNRQHKRHAKVLAKSLKQVPPDNSPGTSPYWAGTTNFNLRKPNFIIIHHTAQNSCDQTLRTFTLPRTQVSAHYVICKDGTIYHMLNDHFRAWHGGVSKWGNLSDLNSSSIGIELDNNANEIFPESQINSLLILLDTLKKRYNIPVSNFIGHADIAPTRKNDPNVSFPWKQLAEKGFGLWWDDTTGVTMPGYFDHLQALRIIGYDMKDTLASIRAFKRHFVQDTLPGFNKADKKILYQLLRKF